MKFSKINALFTEKNIVKDIDDSSLPQFVQNYMDGGYRKPPAHPRPTPAGGATSETWVNAPLFSEDRFRNDLGSSWKVGRASIDLSKDLPENQNFPLDLTAFGTAHNMPPNPAGFGGTIENIMVSGDELRISNLSKDLSTIPVMDLSFILPETRVGTMSSKYNFYIKEYEDATSGLYFSELNLLDSYGTYLMLDANYESRYMYHDDGIAFPAQLNPEVMRYDSTGEPLSTGYQPTRNQMGYPDNNIKNFFRNYAVNIRSQVPSEKYKNVFYPNKSILDVNRAVDVTKESFPYYVGFDIGMSESGPVGKEFENTNLANYLMKNVASTLNVEIAQEREEFIRSTSTGQIYQAQPKVWDLLTVLETGIGGFSDKTIVLGTEEDRKNTFQEENRGFTDVIDHLEFLEGIYNIINQQWRSYSDIIDGDYAYSETLMYRVAKYKKNSTQKPIQNFFFFNSEQAQLFKFMDTQVKVGEEYIYRVFSYSIVLGSEYTYNDFHIGSSTAMPGDPEWEADAVSVRVDEAGNEAGIVVNNNAAIKIVENVVGSGESFVSSHPPVYPNVEFRSFIGEARKIQIIFEDQTETVSQVPFEMSQEEVIRMQKIRKAQGPSEVEGCPQCITFKNDDETKLYEVYRTTSAPETPRSLRGKMWRRVTQKEILDDVTADTTYYYMFRSIDAHGNVSNPSKTFEVTLIGGFSPYLIINEYNYEESLPDERVKERKMKKFLRLRPTMQNLLVKSEPLRDKRSSRDVTNGDIQLGITTEGSIWDKKFKIRLTSIENWQKNRL